MTDIWYQLGMWDDLYQRDQGSQPGAEKVCTSAALTSLTELAAVVSPPHAGLIGYSR